MSDHTMTVEWDGDGYPTYRLKCAADAQSQCRFDWDCDCEEIYEGGVDEKGPWHQIHPSRTDLRHYGAFGGECLYAMWINESDEVYGRGRAEFPVNVTWDGDGYEWTPEADS